MKICFVTTNFPRHLSDSEGTFVWELARAVASYGHRVRVIAQHWPGLPVHAWMEDIEVIRPHYWWPESRDVLRRGGGGLPIIWRESWLARLQMVSFITVHTLTTAHYARGYDVIHAQWTLSAGAAWLGRMVHRRPILVTLQGSDIFQVIPNRVGARLTSFVLRRCDQITAISQALANATATVGIPRSKITVIPNGVNVTQFVPSAECRRPLILYVGTLIKRKGVSYLVKAMAEVAEVHPSSWLIVVGEGPEQTTLERLATDLGLTHRVIFPGLQSREMVRQWMQQAKLLVLPSVEEGLGVVLLEALACGTPIIGTEVGGIPDVVVPEVGLLVPPANSELLAEAICELLSSDSQWSHMSKHARLQAEKHYDWSRIAAQFIKIYEEIST
jgi:glycosyltransferase involved in cell wall biosynthesis